MYKEDLALNNQQWLICHKTQLNKTHISSDVMTRGSIQTAGATHAKMKY